MSEEDDINYICFNQDKSQICASVNNMYLRFTIDPYKLCQDVKFDYNASIFEVLFKTNVGIIVSAGDTINTSQRILHVVNLKTKKEITTMSFPNTIHRVHINYHNLIVLLERTIYIYNTKTLTQIHIIYDIPSNLLSTALSLGNCNNPDDNVNSFLCYPSSAIKGEIMIYDTINCKHINTIVAHESQISCMTFNDSGCYVATSSTKGTVIRIFDTVIGTKLHELRRGLMTYASIKSLSFNSDDVYLSATSDRSTVHIFKLPKCDNTQNKNFISLALSYLPTSVSSPFVPDRSFAYLQSIPFNGNKMIGCLAGISSECILMIVTYDGWLVKYNFDKENGGICTEIERRYISNK